MGNTATQALTPAFLRSTVYLPSEHRPLIARVAKLQARLPIGISLVPGQHYWFVQSNAPHYYYMLTFTGSCWQFTGNARIAPEYIKQVRAMTGFDELAVIRKQAEAALAKMDADIRAHMDAEKARPAQPRSEQARIADDKPQWSTEQQRASAPLYKKPFSLMR